MAETTAKNTGAFEVAIDRLEQIVKLMESGEVSLDESVELFREGRTLIGRCEELLRVAQEAVESAARDVPQSRNAGAQQARAPRPDDDVLPF